MIDFSICCISFSFALEMGYCWCAFCYFFYWILVRSEELKSLQLHTIPLWSQYFYSISFFISIHCIHFYRNGGVCVLLLDCIMFILSISTILLLCVVVSSRISMCWLRKNFKYGKKKRINWTRWLERSYCMCPNVHLCRVCTQKSNTHNNYNTIGRRHNFDCVSTIADRQSIASDFRSFSSNSPIPAPITSKSYSIAFAQLLIHTMAADK